jgi:hypothetical protein
MSLLRPALHKQERSVDLSFRKSLRFEKLSGLTQTTLHWFSERIGSSKKIALTRAWTDLKSALRNPHNSIRPGYTLGTEQTLHSQSFSERRLAQLRGTEIVFLMRRVVDKSANSQNGSQSSATLNGDRVFFDPQFTRLTLAVFLA